MKALGGRTAVVTGAASGIGHAVARRFAAEGMNLVLVDVDSPGLEQTCAELGASAIAVHADVSDPVAVEHVATSALEAFGSVHVLCNIAGVEIGGRFAEIPAAAWRWVLDVNVLGVVNLCRTFLPVLREQEEAHIVNTSSTAAFSSRTPTFAPYIASKAAVLALTESLAIEEHAAGSAVGVSLLVPGPTRTRMTEAERNRPTTVPATAGDLDRDGVIAALRAVTALRGMDADTTAAFVVDAMLENRFYVLSHPELAFAGHTARREWMEGGKVPTPWDANPQLNAEN